MILQSILYYIFIFMYFIQSTVELGAQEAWPINVLPRWLTVTVQHKINCNNIMYVGSYTSVTNMLWVMLFHKEQGDT